MHGVLKHGMIFYSVESISNILAQCIPKDKTPLECTWLFPHRYLAIIQSFNLLMILKNAGLKGGHLHDPKNISEKV
jgi:hypothetical protein